MIINETFGKFLAPDTGATFERLCKKFKGKTLISKGNFVLVRGKAPVMLIAHLDTVHEQSVRQIFTADNGNILTSPQGIGGDDRCGCFALVKTYELSAIKPWLLFTCEEEIGGIGAQDFCDCHAKGRLPAELCDLKCLVEIDRRGANNAVYYDCYNPDFEFYITSKGFKTAFGSFSDISLIAPALNIAAVNLSAGYHKPHRLNEYIVRSELEHTIQKVVEIIADSVRPNFPRYEYASFDFDYDDDSWEYEQDCSDAFPAELPVEYYEIYEELRYVYTVEELEYARKNYGNQILYELHREEFGCYPYFNH